MKILAPVNNAKEVKKIIQAGADEIYCGILPSDWKHKYTNVASSNRREWKTANIESFRELKEIVTIAHAYNIPVSVTLNALYTIDQYALLDKQIEKFIDIKVDALIIADLGLLLNLKKKKVDLNIHISTGGTTFNSHTAKFYENLGVSRIVLPRQLLVEEIEGIVKKCPSIQFEVFVLNSGCKNIDGFCTFHHGVNEIIHKNIWNLPKKLNFDRHFLNLIRKLPKSIAQKLKTDIFGIDSACLLNYNIAFSTEPTELKKKQKEFILENIASSFSLISGIDTCGVCRLSEFRDIGVYGVKVVGRNYSAEKKIKDVKFLKTILSYMGSNNLGKKDFRSLVKNKFKEIYKMRCSNLCYYPD